MALWPRVRAWPWPAPRPTLWIRMPRQDCFVASGSSYHGKRDRGEVSTESAYRRPRRPGHRCGTSRFTVKNEVAPGNPVAPLVWHRELHAENPAIAERIDGGMPPPEGPPWRAAVRGFPPYALLLFCSLPHPSPGVIP